MSTLDEALVTRNMHQKLVFTINDFEVNQTLGVGNFSRVRLVKHKQLETYFALKVMRKGDILKRDQVGDQISVLTFMAKEMKGSLTWSPFPTIPQVNHVKQEINILQMIRGPFYPV